MHLALHVPVYNEEQTIHEVLERVLRLIEAEFPGVHVVRDYDLSLPELTSRFAASPLPVLMLLCAAALLVLQANTLFAIST